LRGGGWPEGGVPISGLGGEGYGCLFGGGEGDAVGFGGPHRRRPSPPGARGKYTAPDKIHRGEQAVSRSIDRWCEMGVLVVCRFKEVVYG